MKWVNSFLVCKCGIEKRRQKRIGKNLEIQSGSEEIKQVTE